MKSIQFSLEKVNVIMKLVKEKKVMEGMDEKWKELWEWKLEGLMQLIIESDSKHIMQFLYEGQIFNHG